MFAIRRLRFGSILKSKKLPSGTVLVLENALERSSKVTYAARNAHHRNPSLPHFKEGSFTSRYFPPSLIEKTEEKIKEILLQKSVQTTEEWQEVKNELFIEMEMLSEVNFSSIVMNCLFTLNKVNEAHSFMKFLDEVHMKPNFLTYLKYMALCGKNVDQCGQEIILQTFEKVRAPMDASPVLDMRRTEHVIQGLSSTDQWRLCFGYLEKLTYHPTTEIKNCLLSAAIRNDDEVLAWQFLRKWLKAEEIPHHRVMKELFLYAQRLLLKDQSKSDVFIVQVFEYMQQKGIIVSEEVVNQIENYFKGHPSEWRISYSKISRKGVCDSCKGSLGLIDLSHEDFLLLRKSFLEKSLKKSDLFINSSKKEFDQYIRFIDSHKPFDFVLDGLNAAHTIQTGRNAKQLSLRLLKIVNRLSRHSDRILVLGRHHMQTWPTSIMRKISEKAELFLTGNTSQDDPFVVYAALASGPDSCMISQDLMRDHLSRLEDPKLIWLFKRWQQTHQVYVTSDEDDKVKFIEPLRYSINVQGSMAEGWHIPYDDGILLDPYEELNNWLCVQRVAK